MKTKKFLFLLVLFSLVFAIFIGCSSPTSSDDDEEEKGGDDPVKKAGAVVVAPTLASKTYNSITINAVAKPANGQSVEYAKSEANSAPSAGWQDGLTFSGLNGGTGYYIFARSKENADYNAGKASAGLSVSTDSQITMTTTKSGSTYIYLLGTGKATIDWGDGTIDLEDLTSSNDPSHLWSYSFPHPYGSGAEKTLTITGNITGFSTDQTVEVSAINVSDCPGLRFLDCDGEVLTVLDLSKNTKLEWLDCRDNQLTALDLSKNTKLEYLECHNNLLISLTITGCNELEKVYCNYNELDADALNAVLYALPDRTGLSQGYIDVFHNSGIGGTGYDDAKVFAGANFWYVNDD